MSNGSSTLPPAAESAAAVLAAAGGRWEVLARHSHTLSVRWGAGGREERTNEESGVACRVTGPRGAGFAAASGRGARAGRQAAEAALHAVLPGPDPLPPVGVLGWSPVPPPPPSATAQRLHEVAARQRHAFERYAGIELMELRMCSGEAHSHFTGEGHAAQAHVTGAVAGSYWRRKQAQTARWAGPSIEISTSQLSPSVRLRRYWCAAGARRLTGDSPTWCWRPRPPARAGAGRALAARQR